ncbi:MAG: hypothetical protein M3Q07_29180 [Pseudobdellovibrionaceae bacterium]|nr:hypothetical protein [Pseudobdellovibrionaceae bacterium]
MRGQKKHGKTQSKRRSKLIRPSPGRGSNINLRIPIDEHPEIVEMLQIRTQAAFEEKYKVSFGHEVKWKTFSTRAAAILDWVAARKAQACEDTKKLH